MTRRVDAKTEEVRHASLGGRTYEEWKQSIFEESLRRLANNTDLGPSDGADGDDDAQGVTSA